MKKKFHVAFGLWSLVIVLLMSTTFNVSANGKSTANGEKAEFEGWLTEVADTRDLDVNPVVTGQILNYDGGQAAKNAAVYLQAWPSSEKLGSMKEGDTFDLVPIAKTVTDSKGHFKLSIDPSIDISDLWSKDGMMDVDVVAWTESGTVTYSFTIEPTQKESENNPFGAQVDHTTGQVVNPIGVNLHLNNPSASTVEGEETVSEVDTGIYTEVGNNSLPADFANGCPTTGTKLVENLGDRLVNVGSIHTATSGKNMKFTYSGSASSTLGVGISASGKYGSFSSSGTVTRSRSTTTTWPWYTSATSRHLDTYFSYGKYCTTTRSPGPSFSWSVRPIKHEGGTNHRSVSVPTTSSSYCVPYRSAGSGGEKASTKTITWSNGAKLSGKIGIDLSSQTGYTTNSKIEYEFKTAGRLCGTHDKPNGSPKRLVMRSL